MKNNDSIIHLKMILKWSKSGRTTTQPLRNTPKSHTHCVHFHMTSCCLHAP